MEVDLSSLLQEIDVPVSGSGDDPCYFVKPIPCFDRHHFGRNSAGSPSLLLSAVDYSHRAPIRLAAIEVGFSIPCKVVVAGGRLMTETLTAITCTATDRILQEYFIRICEMLLEIVGESPSLVEIADAVQRLIGLFQKLTGPPRQTVVGLFGELFVINSAKSPAVALQAWRSATDDRFDFSIADVRLEVKTTTTRHRNHNFTFEQCHPPEGSVGVLVSLFAEKSGGGLSLLDLIEEIKQQIGGYADLQFKLQETIVEALGHTASTAFSMRFDGNVTKSSLQTYELESIPAIRGILPCELSQVRFRSDISGVNPVSRRSLVDQSPYLDDLLPHNR